MPYRLQKLWRRRRDRKEWAGLVELVQRLKLMMEMVEVETEKLRPDALVEGPVGAEEKIVVDNFVIDVGVVVVGGSVGLGFVDVVVGDDELVQHNGLRRWRGSHFGWCECQCRRRVNDPVVRPDVVVVVVP